ncbi:MAG: BspA family leucine-rich repeat surface protein [Bacteroidales bacterium]|nr:BspA family leucine-rich repeat surface protein [Bacteroidales bacterium]
MKNLIKPYKKSTGGKSNVLITLLLAILFLMPTLGAKAQTKEPYIVLKDGTATFYYNSSKPNGALPIQSQRDDANWPADTRNSVAKVVFDASFKDYEPTSCAHWFYNFKNLTEISGIKENLNTANVTTMERMFEGCSSLTTLDVSNFNTANVTDMGSMFYRCGSLTTLDVSNINTANVTDMGLLFYYCSSLTTLDLSNFNTANVTDMWCMFNGCSRLNTIFVGDDWSTDAVTFSESMFSYCPNLYGGKGTAYENHAVDISYARVDGGADNPGYFTKSGDPVYDGPKTYVNIKDGTATFYYNSSKPEGALSIQSQFSDPNWSDTRNSVTKVVFDDSFKDYKPTSCAYWFWNFNNLTEISGMKENLNTANVTDMSYMFSRCSRLTTLDLSNFNTANVKDMWCMFSHCSRLTTLDLSNFNTANVTNMCNMFSDCSSLTTLDLSNFNTANVTDMSYMFYGCSHLTTLDLCNFNTANATDMRNMFYGCSGLKSIFVGDGWSTSAVTSSDVMFEGCAKLYGGKGTAYNANITDATYAKIDGGVENPGYFTKSGDPVFIPLFAYAIVKDGIATFYYNEQKTDGALPMRTEMDDKNWTSSIRSSITKVVFDKSFKDYKPTKLSYWFNSMENLTEISGMENLNTENVEYMSAMFQFSKNLTSIDLSGFNTAKVTDMTRLFYGCENLESIFVGDNWSTASVTKSSSMFEDCTKLCGGKGTAYNVDITDATYAKIDGGKDAPGYFTKSGEPAFKKVVSIEIATAPKTEYTEGEDFSAADGILSLVYNTGFKESIDLSKATITGYDKNKVGEQTLKIAYEGFETELKVTVKANQPTPVSSVADSPSIKVWSYNSTIYIETLPDTKYTIIDLNGRTIKSATTKATKEEVNINKSGVFVVVINGKSFKIAL